MDSASTRSDWISGVAAAATGIAILVMVLFPLAIPIAALSFVAVLPFAVLLIAVVAIAALLARAFRGIRSVGRGIHRALWRSRPQGRHPRHRPSSAARS